MASSSDSEDDTGFGDVIMQSLRELSVGDYVTFSTLKDSAVCIGTVSTIVEEFEKVSSFKIKHRGKAKKDKSRKYSPCDFR